MASLTVKTASGKDSGKVEIADWDPNFVTSTRTVDAVVAVRPAGPAADLDGDGAVSGSDLGLMLGAWGPCGPCPADLDADGTVSGSDLGLLLG
ncbi:MAG: hypothetical protein RLZ84_1599, partial [Actinomycetota bacterium]